MTTLTPVDPREKVLAWLRPILSTILPGWTAGARIANGVTPAKFILVKTIGGVQAQTTADQATIVFQLWGTDGISDDYERTRAGRIVTAQAQRGIGARRISGVISLPDPTDQTRSISQVTVTALLRGEDLA